MFRPQLVLCSWLVLLLIGPGGTFNHGQALIDWNNYMSKFPDKSYSGSALTLAQYYYNYNKNRIAKHNALADKSQYTYRVAENQFSDINLNQFAALLPKANFLNQSFATDTPVAVPPVTLTEFNPITDLGFNFMVQDQGTVCSSSWAYAAAKSVEIMQAVQTATMGPASLSAQVLIDCAGSSTACTTQVPQTAFDYLTQYMDSDNKLVTVSVYENKNTLTAPDMCHPPSADQGFKLFDYYKLTNGDDTSLMKYVGNSIPVIVEYDPATFGFMHYSSGVYQPPTSKTGRNLKTAKASGSQFLLVIGFGHDETLNLDYWLCLNSFGPTWGENGFIRIIRNASQPITKNAIFPNSLAQ